MIVTSGMCDASVSTTCASGSLWLQLVVVVVYTESCLSQDGYRDALDLGKTATVQEGFNAGASHSSTSFSPPTARY